MYLLDTSAIIELFYNTDKGRKVHQLLQGNDIAVSAITLFEIFYGAKENERCDEFFSLVEVIATSRRIANKAALIGRDLKNKGKMINKMDLFIAASAMDHNLTIITCDKDFGKIEKLRTIMI